MILLSVSNINRSQNVNGFVNGFLTNIAYRRLESSFVNGVNDVNGF